MSDNFDPALLDGWGVRASDWSLGLSIQQQFLRRMSVEVSYHRRWFNGFTLNDNQLAKASDYASYSITAPMDSRLCWIRMEKNSLMETSLNGSQMGDSTSESSTDSSGANVLRKTRCSVKNRS